VPTRREITVTCQTARSNGDEERETTYRLRIAAVVASERKTPSQRPK